MNNPKIGKGTLFISGGGDAKQTKVLDTEFSKYIDGKQVMYIPIAMESDTIGFEKCNDWIQSTLLDFKYQDDVPIIDMFIDPVQIKKHIFKYDAIYIGGGNTYYLLNFIKKHNIENDLKLFLLTGGIIYGGSAGGIIMGEDIQTVVEENNKDYDDSKGLNLLNGYSVRCHYEAHERYMIQERNVTYNIKTIALPEDSGIRINRDGWTYFNEKGIIIE